MKLLKLCKDLLTKAIHSLEVTSGMQCACNSLFSICWSTVRRVAIWKNTDLNYILIKGDEVF